MLLSCEDPYGLCWALPAVQTASLLASAVISFCWAGFGLSELPCTRSLPERSGDQPDPLPQGRIQALGLFSGDLFPRPSSLGTQTPSSPQPYSTSWAGSRAREQDAAVPGRISAQLAQAQGAVVSPLPRC